VTSTEPAAGATEVPPGTPGQPTTITLTWSEALHPSTVTTASVGLLRLPQGFFVTLAGLALQQTGAGSARLVLTPRGPLVCDALHEIRWTEAVSDLGGHAAVVPRGFPSFRTTAGCPPAAAIIERFESLEFRDNAPALPSPGARQLAEWFVDHRPVLRAGYGFGGGGVDGPLNVPAGALLDLGTLHPGPVYQFTSLDVASAATVTYTGSAPLRLLCTGDANVVGVIDLSGRGGAPGPANDTSQPVPGGAGRAGGGSGGTANPIPGSLTVPLGARGSGPQSGAGAGYGGHDSHVGTADPTPQRPGCGGGGASYGELGINGQTNCANAGQSGSLRGNSYGDTPLTMLLGGSGGGGGGNAAVIATPAVPFPNLMSHAGGGGGAGGGALAIECAGSFTLGPGGRLMLSGGDAGVGGGPPGGKAGDGGGGSGGAGKVQALAVHLDGAAQISAVGGNGIPGMTAGHGGIGRVRLEDQDGAVLNPSVSTPLPSVGTLTVAHPGRTVGQSLFYDTGLASPAFGFDGSDPGTGRALGNTNDVEFAELPGTGQAVFLGFQGAPPDPANPARPDPDSTRWVPPQPTPASAVPFATDVATLSGRGLRFLRFRVEFDIGPLAPALPPRPAIDTIRIRVQ